MPLQRSFPRFLLAGAANTLGTLAIYLLLLEVLPAFVAWAIAFAIGIVFINIVYPRFVFRVRGTIMAAAGNSAYYVVGFLISETLLSTLTHWLSIGPRISGVVVAAAMVPVNFLVARFFYTRPTGSAVRTPHDSKKPQ